MRAIVVSALLVACGVELGPPPDVDDRDGKADDDDGDDHRLTATKFLGRIGAQYCDACFDCRDTYPDGAMAFAADFGETESACVADVAAYYGAPLVEQSIAAGRVVFDAAKAKACLDGIDYPSRCSQFWETDPTFPAACDVALVGKVADGGACVSIFDCASRDAVCDAKICKR